jgi:hypothetical protein
MGQLVAYVPSGERSRYNDWLRAGRLRGRRFKNSLLQIVQTGSGVHPTFYLMGTGGSFLVGNAAEA